MSTVAVTASLKDGWQGHEAWSNVCAGALMGVAYGAASLWPWRLHPDEPGHGSYFLAEGAGWKEALDFDGSRYVGLVGKILDDLPITEAIPCWDVSANTRGLLDPGVLYVGYASTVGRGCSSTPMVEFLPSTG